MRDSRWGNGCVSLALLLEPSCVKQEASGFRYLFEQVLDGCLGLLFVVCRFWRYTGGLGEL